jgi:CHASE3 domain sensor protein
VRKKGLFAAAAAFAASPQGKRMLRQAKDYVQSPQGKAKMADLKNQVTQRRARPGTTPR